MASFWLVTAPLAANSLLFGAFLALYPLIPPRTSGFLLTPGVGLVLLLFPSPSLPLPLPLQLQPSRLLPLVWCFVPIFLIFAFTPPSISLLPFYAPHAAPGSLMHLRCARALRRPLCDLFDIFIPEGDWYETSPLLPLIFSLYIYSIAIHQQTKPNLNHLLSSFCGPPHLEIRGPMSSLKSPLIYFTVSYPPFASLTQI